MSWLSYALHLHHRTTRSIIVATIAFSLGSAGTALAVRGLVASDNLFHMCAANGGGVRVLEDGDSCKPGEVGFSLPSQAYVDAAMAGVGQGDANTLAEAKSYTDSSVGNEAAARQQGDADTLTSGKSYTDGAVAAEAAARQAADAALQSNLDSEMSARRQGDLDTLAAAKAYTDSRPAGSLSLTILSTRVSNPAQLDPGGTLTASVSCGSGRSLVGGGANSSNTNVVLYQSFPASTLLWTASARAVGTVAPFGAGLTVYAICAG